MLFSWQTTNNRNKELLLWLCSVAIQVFKVNQQTKECVPCFPFQPTDAFLDLGFICILLRKTNRKSMQRIQYMALKKQENIATIKRKFTCFKQNYLPVDHDNSTC